MFCASTHCTQTKPKKTDMARAIIRKFPYLRYLGYMERARAQIGAQPSDIYAMDETAVWFDMLSDTSVDERGAKIVSVRTTGHEKSQCTVILTANGSGRKLKPHVVFFGGRKSQGERTE